MPCRVLVVDDSVDNADALAELIDHAGHTVEVAYSAETALAIAERFPVDVAIVDLDLPRLDGLELGHRLRAQAAGRGIVLVALTGYGDSEARERTRAAGFAAHLTKPVDWVTLEPLLSVGPAPVV